MRVGVAALAGGVAVVGALTAAGCGDAGPTFGDSLREALRGAGLEDSLTRRPESYEGTFRLSEGRFLCALGALGAYCEIDGGRAVVTLTQLGGVTARRTRGRSPFPAGERREIDEGDAIVNRLGSVACGSQDGRSLWCIAPEPGAGFTLDGPGPRVRRLQDSRRFPGGPLGGAAPPTAGSTIRPDGYRRASSRV